MSYSKYGITKGNEVEYILTWLSEFGNRELDLESMCRLDDILEDPDENAWRYAKEHGYIEKVNGINWRLTTSAFIFLEEVAKKGK